MEEYIPKIGENYYYISHCVGCEPSILRRQNCDSLDKTRIAEGNCYKTKKQAEIALKSYKEEWLKTHEDLILKERDTSENKIERLQFIKLPTKNGREQKEFEKMLGHTYEAYYSSFGKGYVIIGCDTEAASKAFADTVYKTLIAAGEDEDFAKACAYEGEDPEMCLYIPKECFVKVKE